MKKLLCTTLMLVTGYASAVTTTPASLVDYFPIQPGAVHRTAQDKLSDTVNVLDFGAKCNGATDDTAGIQAAVNTGKTVVLPVGTCNVLNGITTVAQGQLITGQGKMLSIIKVPSNFNSAAAGVFISPNYAPSSSNKEGPQFRDFSIKFTQPDTSVRGNLTLYPPALYLQNSPRFTVSNLRISEATNGIDMRGDSGGAYIRDLELSSWKQGILIDGSTDTIRITGYHFWPFDVTSNQYNVWNDGSQVALQSARADDLHLSDMLVYYATVSLISSSLGSTFGVMDQSDFDSGGQLYVNAGSLYVSSTIFSTGSFNYNPAIHVSGGSVTCSSCTVFQSSLVPNGAIQIDGTNSSLQIANSRLQSTTTGSFITGGGTGAGYVANRLTLTGNQFYLPVNPSMSYPVVNINSGTRAVITGNQITDLGSGSGTFVAIAADDAHIVANNSFANWGASWPSSSLATYFNNTNSTGTGKSTVQGPVTVNDPSTTNQANLVVNATANPNGAGILLNGNSSNSCAYIRVNGGNLQFVNCGYTAAFASFTPSGNIVIPGSLSHAGPEIDKSYNYVTPATGSTVTIPATAGSTIIDGTGTLASLSVVLPACVTDGQIVKVLSSVQISSITVSSTNSTVSKPPSATTGGGFTWICRAANATWYRQQ